MQTGLYTAALLLIIVGLAHSYLGERYILSPIFRRDNLPRLFGSTEFARQTLRFAWHLTTVAWWGFATILVLLTRPPITINSIGMVIGGVFLIHFVVAVVASRGKHLSWILFLIVGILSIYWTR